MKNTISLTSLVVLLISLHGCSTTRNDYYGYKNTTIVRKSTDLTSEKKLTTSSPIAITPHPVRVEDGWFYDRDARVWRDTSVSSVTSADPISDVTIINNYYTNYTPVISPWWNTYYGDWGTSRPHSYSPWTVWRADCGIPTFYRHYNSWNPHYNDYGFCNYGISWYNPYYNDCNPYYRYWNPVGVYRNGWCTPWYSQSNNPIHTETAPPNTPRTWGLTRVPESNANEVQVIKKTQLPIGGIGGRNRDSVIKTIDPAKGEDTRVITVNRNKGVVIPNRDRSTPTLNTTNDPSKNNNDVTPLRVNPSSVQVIKPTTSTATPVQNEATTQSDNRNYEVVQTRSQVRYVKETVRETNSATTSNEPSSVNNNQQLRSYVPNESRPTREQTLTSQPNTRTSSTPNQQSSVRNTSQPTVQQTQPTNNSRTTNTVEVVNSGGGRKR